MARRGREALTPELQEKLCEAIRAGNTYEVACKYAGISVMTAWRWRKKGEASKSGKYVEFVKAIKKAEAEFEAETLGTIKKASFETWQAAAWMLERRFPQRWAKREYIENKNEHTFPLPREISPDEMEEAEKIIKEISDLRKADGTGDSE